MILEKLEKDRVDCLLFVKEELFEGKMYWRGSIDFNNSSNVSG